MNRKERRAAEKRSKSIATGLARPENKTVSDLLSLALRQHQAGQIAEAEETYIKILVIDPHHLDSLHLLGVIAHQTGRDDSAVDLIGKAISLNDRIPAFHNNIGMALRGLGRVDDAVAHYKKAIALTPTLAEAHNNLGTALKEQGRLDEAVACYRHALALKSDDAQIHNNLGNALKEQGKLDEAVVCYRQALVRKPDYAEAHYNLGITLKDQGKLDEAVAQYRRALALKPRYAEAHNNLGIALQDQGKLDEAVACYRQAIVIKPNDAEVHNNFGNALRDQGELEEAVRLYQRALAIRPTFAEAHNNLGTALSDQGKLDEAVACHRRAIDLKPDYAEAHSNLLMCLNYSDSTSKEEIYKELLSWNAQHGLRYQRPKATYDNERDSQRRLRIGYVSPDFRNHSVAYFLEPLLHVHDHHQFEVFCYSDVLRPDAVTDRLRSFADHWLSTVGMSHDALAERIRKDKIDILIDLAGHTSRNRLPVFARKPAPVQVTWLGYPNTTGLQAIDYRLVDAVSDPAGEADGWASETLLRLEGGFLCYGGMKDAPEPTAPPCLGSGTVTFGSFNNPAKLSPATLDAWASLLARLPQARLLLKGKPFADAATRALLLTSLGECGVAVERVELVAWVPNSATHLALYDRIDITLDPFPYNGTTTTCEALWMGVPVVTLRGDRHAGRVGASLLSQIGLTDWIAGSVQDYVAIAVALAANPGRLQELRGSLRQRLAASPLCDGKAFARKIEAAYRTMWRQWCGGAMSGTDNTAEARQSH